MPQLSNNESEMLSGYGVLDIGPINHIRKKKFQNEMAQIYHSSLNMWANEDRQNSFVFQEISRNLHKEILSSFNHSKSVRWYLTIYLLFAPKKSSLSILSQNDSNLFTPVQNDRISIEYLWFHARELRMPCWNLK